MAGEWKTAALDSLCELIADCPHSTPVWTAGGVVVLRSQNIRGGRLDLSSPSYTDEEHFQDRIRRAEPTAGDLVITREAPMGEVCQIPPGLRCCLGQRMVLLRPNRLQADSRYLLFALQSRAVQTQIMWAEGTGSTVSNLRIPDLKKLKIPSPPINEQRAIAHILGSLDDKIELNRRRNQTLEAMARALFKDWFVDFGPVRAKMEGREPYLPADLWQLFPDRLDDEGKPEGWKDDCLGSFTNIKNGYAFKSKDWCEAGVPVVKIGSVKPSFVDISQVSFIDVTLAREKESFRLNVGDMLVGLTGYVGETGRIPPTDNRPMLNQRVGKLEPFDSLEPFVFACVRMPDFKVFAESKAHGSAQANVSTTELLKYPVVNPGRELLEAFCRMLEPLFLKSLANEGEQATLSRLRDTLLPKLISGELRIPGAEQFLERAEDNVPNKKRSLP